MNTQRLADDSQIEKVFFLIDRKDLDDQTVDEYNSFELGCVDNTPSTKRLVANIEDSTKTMIITTIQKMATALHKEKVKRSRLKYIGRCLFCCSSVFFIDGRSSKSNRFVLTEILNKFYVIKQSEPVLLVMRPYQIYAVKMAYDRVKACHLSGFVHHTTESGKTLTSFKLATLLRDDSQIEKVFFLIDRKDFL